MLYWIETSSNDLVRELLVTGPEGVNAEMETLLAGAVCRSAIWPESGRPMTSTFGLRDRVETRGSDTRVLLWVGEDTADLVWKRIAQPR